MKAIKVNADYESVLFSNKAGPKILNESLEFLSLLIEKRPLFSLKKYDPEYLDYVQEITGNIPVIVNQGEFENWWGDLTNISLEKKLNSKEFTVQLNQDAQLISGIEDLKLLEGRSYLAKSPYGMSGQNFQVFQPSETEKLIPLLQKSGKVLVEPYFQRKADFSHYVFSPESEICYENLVDKSFQYKGTLFANRLNPTLHGLRFYHQLDPARWEEFHQIYLKLKELCLLAGAPGGYSVDSFTYQENHNLCIRAVSEINFRKTMGLVAWKLSEKFAGMNSWTLLLSVKPLKKSVLFSVLRKRLEPICWNPGTKKGVILLSPGDTRFHYFLLIANSQEEGTHLYRELKSLLPDGQFSVEV